jgi:uncharacterized membrane protein YeaQ/YmgE (transglycosylase-associated protein family)
MEFIWMILVGLLAGALAKFVMPGRDPGGMIVTILLGIGGALFAGWLGRTAGWYGPADPGPGIIAATIGAILILAIYRLVIGRRDRAHPV